MRIQTVYSEKRKVLKERYLTKSGLKSADKERLTKKEALKKYGKNRYTVNHEAKVVKQIKHVS